MADAKRKYHDVVMTRSSKYTNRRPLAERDLRINRTIALVVLLVGAVFVYSLAFTTFEQRVQFQWNVEADGSRTPMIYITCPSPWAVLVHDAEPEVATSPGFCVKESRALAVEAVLAALATIAIVAWFLSRKTRPGELPPLPESLRALNRSGR